MRRRGLTLIELLVAIVLLGGVCSLLTSWLVTVGRLSSDQGPRMQWRSAATRVLDAVGDDLMSGDFQLRDRRRTKRDKFEITNRNDLSIKTRSTQLQVASSPGPVTHLYHLDLGENLLTLTIVSEDQSKPKNTRPMLSDATNWRVLNDEKNKSFTVTIRSRDDDEVSRRYSWP